MTVAKVLIVGAAGQTGKHIIKAVKEEEGKGAKLAVQAGIFTDMQKEQEAALQKFEGLDIVSLDWQSVDKLVEAMREVDELVLVPLPISEKFLIMRNCLAAAKKAQVGFVCLISMFGADNPEFCFGQQYREVEEALGAEGFPAHCIVRPQYYVQNLLLLRDLVKKGTLPIPIGKGKFAPIDADDVGMAIARILQEPATHAGKTYSITGPEALSTAEMATKLSKATGGKVKGVDEVAPAKAHLKQAIPAPELLGVLELYQLVAEGKLSETTGDFEKIMGRPGASFDTWAKEHVDFFK